MYAPERLKVNNDEKSPPAKYLAVMLIDDNRIDNFIARNVIGNFNFACHTEVYTNAEIALEFLIKITGKDYPGDAHYPDFIFLDINMPHMNGFQFLKEFETIDFKDKQKPRIIMLTSSISQGDIDKAFSYGSVHKYLCKPLSEKDLETL